MYLILTAIFAFNIFFFILWSFRFSAVFFQLNIEKLRNYKICLWLKYIYIDNYDDDLEKIVLKKAERQKEPSTSLYSTTNRNLIEDLDIAPIIIDKRIRISKS